MIINILWLVLKTYILQSLSKNYVLIFLKSKNFKSPNWMTYTFVVNTLTHCASRKITILGKKKFRKLYCFLWFWSKVRQKMEVQHTTLTNKDIYEGILRFSWLDGNVGSVIKICLGVLQIILSTVKYFINFPKNWFISVTLFTVYNCNKNSNIYKNTGI